MHSANADEPTFAGAHQGPAGGGLTAYAAMTAASIVCCENDGDLARIWPEACENRKPATRATPSLVLVNATNDERVNE